jgi:NitT/TauT family transport system substrate-binding protein
VSFTKAIMTDLGMAEGTDYTFLPVGDGGTAAVAFLRDEVGSYAGAVSDAAILASRGLTLREITPEAYLGFFGNGIAMLESQMAATPDLAPKFGKRPGARHPFRLGPGEQGKGAGPLRCRQPAGRRAGLCAVAL